MVLFLGGGLSQKGMQLGPARKDGVSGRWGTATDTAGHGT
jgi:hypothetical protein